MWFMYTRKTSADKRESEGRHESLLLGDLRYQNGISMSYRAPYPECVYLISKISQPTPSNAFIMSISNVNGNSLASILLVKDVKIVPIVVQEAESTSLTESSLLESVEKIGIGLYCLIRNKFKADFNDLKNHYDILSYHTTTMLLRPALPMVKGCYIVRHICSYP